MTSFFITGTDTNIGKTVIAAALVYKFNAHYWKPLQTGALEGTDTDFVRNILSLPKNRIVLPAYTYNPPLSPHLAANLENDHISLETIALPAFQPIIVEGAGGIFVPINNSLQIIDLIEKFSLPVIVVSGTQLGTINHTLLTLYALQNRGLAVKGVVLNGAPQFGIRATIEHFSGVQVLGEIPRYKSLETRTIQAIAGQIDA
jgi:malonyl-CoA O-methyltransferase